MDASAALSMIIPNALKLSTGTSIPMACAVLIANHDCPADAPPPITAAIKPCSHCVAVEGSVNKSLVSLRAESYVSPRIMTVGGLIGNGFVTLPPNTRETAKRLTDLERTVYECWIGRHRNAWLLPLVA